MMMIIITGGGIGVHLRSRQKNLPCSRVFVAACRFPVPEVVRLALGDTVCAGLVMWWRRGGGGVESPDPENESRKFPT